MKSNKFNLRIFSSTALFLCTLLLWGCGSESNKPVSVTEEKPLETIATQAVTATVDDETGMAEAEEMTSPTGDDVSLDEPENTDTYADTDSTEQSYEPEPEVIEEVQENPLEVITANSDIIRAVQKALVEQGFNAGKADGVSGTKTLTALVDFQKTNGLTEGELTRETLQALDVNF